MAVSADPQQQDASLDSIERLIKAERRRPDTSTMTMQRLFSLGAVLLGIGVVAQKSAGRGRVLDQLTGIQPVPHVANDLLSASLLDKLGVAGGFVVRTPSAYVDVVPPTPRGVARSAVVWDDAVLTLDDGKDVSVHGEALVWHLAQLCERCGTLLLPRSVQGGLTFIDNSDELVEALDGAYRPFVPGCPSCRGPSAKIPPYERQWDCASRFSRKKRAHNFTVGSPGPWTSGDMVWCLDCGKQDVAGCYFPLFQILPGGGGGVGM
jgi:hypothetical protein